MLVLKRTRSPKHVPSIRRFPVIVAVLLSTASADTLVGNSQLVDAARDGNVDTVRQLLAEGVDAKSRNNALLAAVGVGEEMGDVAPGLSTSFTTLTGVSLDGRVQKVVVGHNFLATGLPRTVSGAHTAVVEALLASGADVNAKTPYGTTALYLAARWGHIDSVRALLSRKGIEVDSRTYGTPVNFAGPAGAGDRVRRTPLLDAIATGFDHRREEDRFAVVQALVDHGADVNAVDHFGDTPLRKAISWNKMETIRFLLDHGVNVRGKEGKLALKLAQEKGNQVVISLLREARGRK